MGQLPSARVLPTFANDRVSVDYAGLLTLKVGSTRKPTYRKAYVAIFVVTGHFFVDTTKAGGMDTRFVYYTKYLTKIIHLIIMSTHSVTHFLFSTCL